MGQAKGDDVLVLGDSIGRDTYHALSQAFPDTNFIMLHQSACPPSGTQGLCFRSLESILAAVIQKTTLKGIVISFRYRPDEWKTVTGGIDLAKSVTPNVWLFGASPVFTHSLSDMVKRSPGTERIMYITDGMKNLTPWSFKKIADEAQELADEENINFFEVNDFYCVNLQCSLWINNIYGEPLYIDKQHLTSGGIRALSTFLKGDKALASSLSIQRDH